MKAILLVGTALIAAAVGLALLVLQSRRSLNELDQPVASASAPAESAPRLARKSTPPSTDGLSEVERLELLRLRGQVQPLLARQAELKAASNRNAQLKAQLQAARGASAFPPPDYISRAAAQNRGNASPEAALETFLWAIQNHDTNALFSVVGGQIRDSMVRDLATSGTDPFFKSLWNVPGARIGSRTDSSPEEALLTLELGPGLVTPVKFRKVEGGWRMIDL